MNDDLKDERFKGEISEEVEMTVEAMPDEELEGLLEATEKFVQSIRDEIRKRQERFLPK